MRRIAGLVTAFVLLVGAGAATAEPPAPSTLRISGLGGQSAVLTVPAGGMRVEYPFFSTPRLPGPDGTVGGVLIQDLRTREALGGLLLQNVPGFSTALETGLLHFERVDLRPGRYVLTLLGTDRQTVTLPVRHKRGDLRLNARGPARPITTTAFDASSTLHTWSAPVQLPAAESILVLGSGAGGDNQQISYEQSCFRAAAEDDGRCLPADSDSTFVSPGAGAAASWSSFMFLTDAGQAGDYVYSGRAVSLGTSSTAAHSSLVIRIPR
ncbi:MAG: hypothetical protein EPN99_01780 [Frankiales bacterium]|nr:MAG: hypothetical protein EPN99_01780 [Frankiales bacterium]